MASAVKEYGYLDRGLLSGDNTARKLDWEVSERELRHAGEAPRHETRKKTASAAREREEAQVRKAQRVSVLSVLGVMACAALAVLLLMNYVRLTTLASDTVSLKKQLTVLEAEKVSLSAQYEQMFDMATVKRVAAEAGMTKPSASQVFYLDLSGEDSAVIYETEDTTVLSRVLTSLHHGVYAVMEYFE
ncbi:MAG: hypothetical protein IKN53_06045 [Oscillibacter sp.]|nr:hypothetical protein [Oscillibacter sp.]